MKTRILETVGIGVLATLATANAAFAQEFLNANISVSHSATPAGAPKNVTSTGGQFLTAGPATIFSVDSIFGPTVLFRPTSSGPPTNLNQSPFFFSLTPARTALSSNQSFNLFTADDIAAFLGANQDMDFSEFEVDITEDCFRNPIVEPNFGVPASTVLQLCDAISLRVDLSNNVTVTMTGAEDNPDLTFTIPAAGITFTSNLAQDRDDAMAQFGDFLQTGGRNQQVAAALLGRPAGSTLPLGSLPTAGTFLTFSANIMRSAAGSTQFDPPQSAVSFQRSFAAASFGEVLAYVLVNDGAELEDFGLPAGFELNDSCFRETPTGPVFGRCDAYTFTLGLLGFEATMSGQENNPNMTIVIPEVGVNFTTTGALDTDDAAGQIDDFIEANVTDADLFSALQRVLIANTPNNPVAGNPTSLQGTLVRTGLDLSETSLLLDEDIEGEAAAAAGASASGRGVDTAGWMVGGRVGTVSVGTQDAVFVDVVAERGWRVGEGSRSRLKVSVPFSYADYDDSDGQSTASVRVGYETPLREGRWVLEPSLALGYAFDSGQFAAGALWAAGLSSRYKIAPVGRGHIVIGNAVTYTNTIEIEDGEDNVRTPILANTIFRNGAAYQYPIGERIFGRLGTLRGSYSYTFVEGDEVFLDEYHDVSLSYGIGSREATVRQISEIARIGFTGTFGEDYEAFSLNLGFRF